MVRVAIFDDILAARGEIFQIPGLEITVHAHADDAVRLCTADIPPKVVFMDFAMGPDHVDGAEATTALRAAGFGGRIIATSSDPAMNARMIECGASEALAQKAMLRSFLVALGKEPTRTTGPHRIVRPPDSDSE
jgi:DNA-binding NarL/FixJ family response regulator